MIDLKNTSSFTETVAIDFPSNVVSDSTRVEFSLIGQFYLIINYVSTLHEKLADRNIVCHRPHNELTIVHGSYWFNKNKRGLLKHQI